MNLRIREEKLGDFAAIREVNAQAFGGFVEADIVEELRTSGDSILSLVAFDDDEVVGHVQFSPVVIDQGGTPIEGVGLGPMAVLPDHQGKGIGTELVGFGLKEMRARSYPFVVVLGYSDYYPRFGFEQASTHRIACQWKDIPDEAFMVLVLDEQRMHNVQGVASYRDVFDEAG